MADENEHQSDKPPAEVKRRRNSIELERVDSGPAVRDSNLSATPAKAAYSRPEVIYAPEKSVCPMSCLKFALVGFNTIIWLLGVALIAVGAWMKADPQFWTFQTNLDMKHFHTGAIVAILVGVVIVVIGFVGFCGAIHENLCLLSVYLVVAILILVLEAVVMGVVWTVLNNKDTQEKVAELIRKGINSREEKSTSAFFIDLLQSKLHCCGVQGPDEYETDAPKSCVSPEGRIYKDGCLTLVIQYLRNKAAIIGGVAIGALLLQIGAVVLTVAIICSLRTARKEIF